MINTENWKVVYEENMKLAEKYYSYCTKRNSCDNFVIRRHAKNIAESTQNISKIYSQGVFNKTTIKGLGPEMKKNIEKMIEDEKIKQTT